MTQGPFELCSQTPGALPIVDTFLERVDALLERVLGATDARVALRPAKAIGLLVRNLCVNRLAAGRGDRAHQAGRARVDPARSTLKNAGQPGPRYTLLPEHSRRAHAARDQHAGGHGRRRVRRRCERTPRSRTLRPSRRSSLAARNQTPNALQPPAAALPHGRRGPNQPPQTLLRTGPLPPERRRRPADLDRMGDPRLHHRHPR